MGVIVHRILDSTNNRRQQQLNSSIIQNLIVDMSLPLSIVERDSFKKFMHDVDPRYKMISRRSIVRSHLPNAYARCAEKMRGLCNQSSHVSLTLDIWTDRRMRSYLGITMHTVIDDKFQSLLLSFERLEGKHSWDKLGAEFDRVIQMYGLENKLVRLITDNASNNRAAFDKILLPGFEEYFDDVLDDTSESEKSYRSDDDDEQHAHVENGQLEKTAVEDSVWQKSLPPLPEQESLRLPCFAHSLQLVVNDGIEASGPATSALRKVALLAKLVHQSGPFAEKLEKAQVSIPRAVQTRWNSQFHTVKKVMHIPSFVLNGMLTDLKKNTLILNIRDRKVLEEFVSLFELFNEATKLTQAEQYTTIGLVAPSVLGLLHDLEHELESSTLTLTSLCQSLLTSLKARFSGLLRHFEVDVPTDKYSMSERYADPIFLITPLFDPRFKLLWLDSIAPSVKARVIDKIYALFVCFFARTTASAIRTRVNNDVTIVDQNIEDTSTDVGASTKRKCLFPYVNDKKKTGIDGKEAILSELDDFLREKSDQMNLIFSKKHIYLSLHQLAFKYLSVPATSAPIERVFSCNGFVMRPHRASLTSRKVCTLPFLKCNKDLFSN